MRNIILIIAALIVAAGIGYWLGQRGPERDLSSALAKAETHMVRADSIRDAATRARREFETASAEAIRQLADEVVYQSERAERLREQSRAASAESARLRAIYKERPSEETCDAALSACQTETAVLQEEIQTLAEVNLAAHELNQEQHNQLVAQRHHYDQLLDAYGELRVGCEVCMGTLAESEQQILRLERQNQTLKYTGYGAAAAALLFFLIK